MTENKVLVGIDNYLENISTGQFFKVAQNEEGRFNIVNRDDFDNELNNLYKQLENIEYTDDDRKTFKKIRANFNKVSKKLTEDLKTQKEFYFGSLDDEIKEIKTALEDFSGELKKRLDESEKRFRQQKEIVVKKHFDELIDYKPKEISDIIKLEDIFDSRWLNRTFTEKQIIDDLNFRIDTLENLIKDNVKSERYVDAIKVMNEFDFDSTKIFEIINRFSELELEKMAAELAKKDKEKLQKLLEEEKKQAEEEEQEEQEQEEEKITPQVQEYVTIKLKRENFDKIKQIFQNLEIDFEMVG